MKLINFLFAVVFLFAVSITQAQEIVIQDDVTTVEEQVNVAGANNTNTLLAQATDTETSTPIQDDLVGFDEEPQEQEESSFFDELWAWLLANWMMALLGLLGIIEIVVNLTPTEKDNAWFVWLRDIINSIIPNNRKGGGVHTRT